MSAWTERQWNLFFDLLDNGWPGELKPDGAEAYRILLDGTDPEQVVEALRRLLHGGQRFRPSATEILSASRRDPSRPTFAEALQLIRHCLRARPPRTGGVTRYANPAERDKAEHDAIADRVREVHPLVAAFIARQGIDRLRTLGLDDAEYGEARRHNLEAEWDQHVETADGRQVAALAAGGPQWRRGLQRLDPVAALSLPGTRTSSTHELEQNTRTPEEAYT